MGIFVSLDLDWGPSVLTLLTAQDAATSLGANVMSVDCLLQHMTNDNVFAKQQLVYVLRRGVGVLPRAAGANSWSRMGA